MCPNLGGGAGEGAICLPFLEVQKRVVIYGVVIYFSITSHTPSTYHIIRHKTKIQFVTDQASYHSK